MKIKAISNIKHDGTLYPKGKTFDIDDEPGQILVDSKVAREVDSKRAKAVDEDQNEDLPTMNNSREELNDFALEVGVKDPEGLPNKEAVFDQIQEAQDK